MKKSKKDPFFKVPIKDFTYKKQFKKEDIQVYLIIKAVINDPRYIYKLESTRQFNVCKEIPNFYGIYKQKSENGGINSVVCFVYKSTGMTWEIDFRYIAEFYSNNISINYYELSENVNRLINAEKEREKKHEKKKTFWGKIDEHKEFYALTAFIWSAIYLSTLIFINKPWL